MFRRTQRTSSALAVLMCLVAGFASGQDFQWEEPGRASVQLEPPGPKRHAGLLGRAYVEGRYQYLNFGEDSGFAEDHMHGFAVAGNAPVFWQPAETPSVGADIFVSYSRFMYEESGTTAPPTPVRFEFDLDFSTWAIGTSLYANLTENIRPFVQLGAELGLVESSGRAGSSTFEFREHDDDLLLNAGVEVDVTSYAALRAIIDIDTGEELGTMQDDHVYIGELIVWPTDHLFFHSGAMTPFRDRQYILFTGAGLAW